VRLPWKTRGPVEIPPTKDRLTLTQKGIVYLGNDLAPAGRRGILLSNPDRGDTTQLGVIEVRWSIDPKTWVCDIKVKTEQSPQCVSVDRIEIG